MTKSNKVFIAISVIAIAMILASVITLCVFCTFADGVDVDKVQVSIDGNVYSGRAEVKVNSSYNIEVDAKGFDYYLCIDSDYGYISDNKVLHINDELRDMTLVPLRVVIVKANYAVNEYVCNLVVTM